MFSDQVHSQNLKNGAYQINSIMTRNIRLSSELRVYAFTI